MGDNRLEKIKERRDKISKVISMLDSLDEDDRLEILSRYCNHCGGSDLSCQCSNDE